MFSGIFKWFGDSKKPNKQIQTNEVESNKKDTTQTVHNKTWKNELEPERKIRLWGWDSNNNPSFLVLYGKQEFAESQVLEDDVTYTSYMVWSGQQGHLPAFEAVKIFSDPSYADRKNEKDYPKMFYKKAIGKYWKIDLEQVVIGFTNLREQAFSLPYFDNIPYEQLVRTIQAKNIDFQGFKFAKNPNDVIKLNENLKKYYENCCYVLSYDNIYMRKKFLNKLINQNPPKELYELLYNIGSTELLSGLFLKLAENNNDVLLQQAKTIVENDITWASPTYGNGLKRCAQIYINALTPSLKKERINWLEENVSQIDSKLISINGKNIDEKVILEGHKYRKYSLQGLFSKYVYSYDYEKRQSIRTKRPDQFAKTFYCDGSNFDFIKLKNTIQEAFLYELPAIIGKIAYFLDAPRLVYHSKGTGKGKALSYYKKYLRRIIDNYAKNDPDKFMQAMKSLFTSYTPLDSLSKYGDQFHFNFYIKHYLYYRFDEKPPSNWFVQDQLAKLDGRYEMMPEIWDNHLDTVLEIATNAQVAVIQKACYFILQSSPKKEALIEQLSYSELIKLSQGSYEPLANWFREILLSKIELLTKFDFQLMFELLNSPSEAMHEIAIQHFNKTNGEFTPHDTASLLLLDNFERWETLFEQNFYSLTDDKYNLFVQALIDLSDQFEQKSIKLSKTIQDLLSLSSNNIEDTSLSSKSDLLSFVINSIFQKQTMPEWLEKFLEEIIFSLNYNDLLEVVHSIDINQNDAAISTRCRQIFSMLESVRNQTIPSDAQVVSILETGTAKIIKTLSEMMSIYSKTLHDRYSTVLIMFESDITTLNIQAKEIFYLANKTQQEKLHKALLDSPVKKVYLYALEELDRLYGDMIPAHFIKQLMEHTAQEVKAFISDKINKILNDLENADVELFIYYMKTILLLPNKVSKGKEKVYQTIPLFVKKHADKTAEIEDFLIDVGGSNLIIDSERALTTLAKIKKEAI